MLTIAFVYFSKTDVTGQLVRAACDAITDPDLNIICHQIQGYEIVEGRFDNPALMATLKNVDAIVFGSPTYMGSVAAQFKAFADATSDFWESQAWANKVAAGITSGSGLNGDQGATLSYMSLLAGQHGMFWVGLDQPYTISEKDINRLGCHTGVTAQSTDGLVHDGDFESAQYVAQRVVTVARQLQGL